MTADAEAGRSYDADGKRWYTYPPTGELLRSVTSVIGGTQDKPWLAPWAAKLAVQWTIDNYPLLATLGRDEFERQAKTAAERARDLKSAAGSYTHALIEALILWQAGRGEDIALPTLPEALEGQLIDELPAEKFTDMCINGFLNFCSDHQPQFLAAEMKVYNPQVGVAGTLDFIPYLPHFDVTGCVDAKTGRKVDGDVQEQLAAYRRMTQALMPMGELVDMPATDAGFVLHLRPELHRGYRLIRISDTADVAGWNRFRRALRTLAERDAAKGKPGTVVYPPLPDGSQPPMRLADLDGEGYGRLLSVLVKAGLETVADVAAFTEDDCLAVRNMGVKTLEIARRMLADHGLSFAGTEQNTEVA